ncbi:MAG: caspase family protein, partial [Elusimicrobia bacterium]|nr:caspase family protein [Elusimicrobiota bacterium]
MKATVTRAGAKWNAGFGVRVDGDVRVLLTLKESTGREVWEGELTGTGVGTAGGGGVPSNGIRQAWAAALNEAMSRLGPLLDSERPWRLLGKAPVQAAELAVKAVPTATAPPSVRSDVDELPSARPESAHRHAVVIGVERYRESLPTADFAAGDARLVAEYFKRVLGVPEQNLALLTDDRAAKSDFEKYFERWLPNRVEAGDEVFVYFSGHGSPNPAKGDAYLVPYDGDPTYIDQTGYPLKRLYGQLAKLPAKSVVVAMDSCFSGAGGRSVIAKGARPLVSVSVSEEVPERMTVLAASAG